MNTVIFDDGLEPTTVYTMDSPVTQPGTYTGETYDGREITLDVVFAKAADLKNEAPDLLAQGVSGCLVVARISGSEGTLPIAGVVIETGSVTLDDQPLLQISDILTEDDFSVFADATRIAGGVRVMDTSTFLSEPLATADFGEGSVWMSADDPATLFTGPADDAGEPIPNTVEACVELAYKHFQIDADAAGIGAAICLVAVMAAFVACMAVCAVLSLTGPIGLLGAALCAGACLATQAIGSAACVADVANDMRAARQRLQLALQACGVDIQ